MVYLIMVTRNTEQIHKQSKKLKIIIAIQTYFT